MTDPEHDEALELLKEYARLDLTHFLAQCRAHPHLGGASDFSSRRAALRVLLDDLERK